MSICASYQNGGIILKVEMVQTNCIYFCCHFYKIFKDTTKIKDAFILKNHLLREVLCYCENFKNKIKNYFCHYNTLSDEFFFKLGNY